MQRMSRAIGWAWLGLSSLATALFGLWYYQSYWRWRACFNSEGNCWDGVVNHHVQNEVLVAPLVASALALLGGLWFVLTRRV